jgi:hypothetical protein
MRDKGLSTMLVLAQPKRAALPLVSALLLVLTVLAASEPRAAAAVGDGQAKIEQRLATQLARGGKVTFWVVVEDRADLASARRIPDWNRRGRFVVDELRAVADRSQAGLRSVLRATAAKHRSFWIANAIRVTGDQALARELVVAPGITQV